MRRACKLLPRRKRRLRRARERFAREQAEYEAKVKARADNQKRSGNKPGGKPPSPPTAGVGPREQVNLTDAESRIMPRRAVGSSKATTRRPRWTPTRCWWWPRA